MPKSILHKLLYKHLHLFAHKLQLLHGIMADDSHIQKQFGISKHQLLDNDNFLKTIMFSFPALGKLNKQNI
jgi:hypothetical protein